LSVDAAANCFLGAGGAALALAGWAIADSRSPVPEFMGIL